MAVPDNPQQHISISIWQHLALSPGRTLGTLQRGTRDECVVVTAAALAFDRGREYKEADVNLALERWLAGPGAMLATDRVELRRARQRRACSR